jgi:hypothetical protein
MTATAQNVEWRSIAQRIPDELPDGVAKVSSRRACAAVAAVGGVDSAEA